MATSHPRPLGVPRSELLQRQNLAKNPANSGLVSDNQEISVSGKMRGGADKREAIALPIEKVRELIDQAMSSMATTRARR